MKALIQTILPQQFSHLGVILFPNEKVGLSLPLGVQHFSLEFLRPQRPTMTHSIEF
jgi:hypothetical protein